MSVLALDLGGTNFRAMLADASDLRPGALPDPVMQGPAPSTHARFIEILDALVEEHRPDAIGLAIPGLATGTVCQWVPNLPWLNGTDLAAQFPALRVRVANDAHMALLAEAVAGAAQEPDSAILIAVGTGIGSALMVDRRVARNGATSFGWACADVTAPGQERDGWLESVAAGRALDRAAQGVGLPDGPALIEAARKGEAAARAALAPAQDALGTTLAGAVALTGAERVIVSGGVARALDVIGPPVLDRLRAHLPPHLRGVTIVAAAFGASASLAGAAIACTDHPVWEDKSR
ncbi:ROK family protein [Frigidibacter sp. ROC022]|uniref:ROK family protein n=1 Tax=Frigidibacter sp. ROC022 TaxID=2971796 RepID=UPI00215A8B39|nr:ROK family protein [Frigidibacter sp. ROC022]MCR8724621.1 ROK family protein [Frigidibacter sp. ROC022]